LAKIHFTENDDLLDIRKDNVFKAVFTRDTPESKKALGKLVSALIGREVTIDAIYANEPPIDNLNDRQIRFDIFGKDEAGEPTNVEMCLHPNPYEPVRLEFHVGKLFIGQEIRGKNRNYNDLKQAYQIAILANKRFFRDDIPLHAFEYYDPAHKISLNGRSRIITLELSKLSEVVEKPIKDMKTPERWGAFFQYLRDKSKRGIINEIMNQEEGIAMASEVLINISKDEAERFRLLSWEKHMLDAQSDRSYERQEARAEGHAEGVAENKLEIARNLKKMGLPVSQIAEGTGLSLETIDRL
jgi:predicted transposase/invertase (TIGR01784 family)